jgi:hypothetical protein
MAAPDSTPASDVAIDLVAQLEAEAAFVEAGSFTLDASKAREKLAAYQLTEPERFVLLLVEAAHLLPNCTGVAFTIDSSSTKVVFHGAELPGEELHGCFDAMFIDVAGLEPEQARAIRGRQRLALALNTALSLSDGNVEMTSMSAGGGSVHAVFDRDGRVQTHEQPGTSLTSALVVEVRSRQLRDTQRELLLRDARYATIPVRVDDNSVAADPSADILTPVEIRNAAGQVVGRLGWCAAQARRESGGIALVANGVVVETHHAPELPIGSLALVDAGELQRDISQAKFQRDEAFRQRVEAVAASCDALSQPVPTLGPRPTEMVVRGVVLLLCGMFMIVLTLDGVGSSGLEPAVAYFLTSSLVTGCLGIWLLRRGRRRDRVRMHGHAGLGIIKSSSPTGFWRWTSINMWIERSGQDGYGTTFLAVVGTDSELIQPGRRVYMRVDPNDPNVVVFESAE